VLLPEQYLLVSLGTGTSILEIKKEETRRVSGSTLGGGTLLGLSRLLGCSDSYSELLTLAARGDRSGVDLLVRDLAPSADNIVLPRDTTASSFGKLDSKEPADLAHALIWLIGENIGILCNAVARPLATQTIVFGGGLLAGNRVLEDVICQTLADQGNVSLFLQDGIFCGAAGAASFVGTTGVSRPEFLASKTSH
jgi:type II pantothenate kinase